MTRATRRTGGAASTQAAAPIAPSAIPGGNALRLRLLGTAELRSGSVTRFLPERRFRLLAFLAVRADWVGRDELATLFWPDRSQDAARSNLRKLLLEVRALDPPGLESDRDALRWSVPTDVVELRSALGRADHATVLALYRGPFAHGLDGGDSEPFARWLTAERDQLRTAWRDAVLHVLPQRPPEVALDLAQQLIADDPLDEEALRGAVRALAALGRIGEAQRLCGTFAERVAEELGVEASSETRALAASLDRGAAVARAASPAAGVHDDGFVGRTKEMAELAALVSQPDCRLLTVTGPGGIGKSRLVKQALRIVGPHFPDAAWWIALDDLADTSQVASRIATEIGVAPGSQRDPLEQIVARLGARKALLVLDNSEHLPRLAGLVTQLLRDAPNLKVLATSRARFGVDGEWLVPLVGLAVPPIDAPEREAMNCDAVRLFAAAALRARPNFDLRRDLPHVVALVRAVGGLPLAILIAASWLRLLPAADLAAEVAESLDVLESADEGEERAEHRSLRATFERSWQMLAPQEQQSLAQLAVFVGGFAPRGAKEVAGASLPLLASLVDKSLVQAVDAGRFALHPLIRQFSMEKLGERGGSDQAAERHADFFRALLARMMSPGREPNSEHLLEIERELPNCRAAWQWAACRPAPRVLADGALPLMHYFELRGRAAEGVELLGGALSQLSQADPAHRAAIVNTARAVASLNYRLGRYDEAIASARRALKLARELALSPALKGCLNVIGLSLWQRGRYGEARRYFEQMLKRGRADNDDLTLASALGNLGLIEKATGNFERAIALYTESLQLERKLGAMPRVANKLNNLGNVHRTLHDWPSAIAAFEEGLAICDAHGLSMIRRYFVINLALTYFALGDNERAARLGHEALADAHDAGDAPLEVAALLHISRLATRRRNWAEAIDYLRRARAVEHAMGNPPLQLTVLSCFAEWLAAQGDAPQAAQLWQYVMAHEYTSAGDAADARAWLHQLPAEVVAASAPPSEGIETLLARLDETAGT